MIKIYDFNYDMYEAGAKFEVDTDKFSPELAKETLDFFTWDYDQEANPIDEVMKKYAMSVIRISTFENYNTYGVIEEFKKKEGFCSIDGSMGIKLIDVTPYEFDWDQLQVEISQI